MTSGNSGNEARIEELEMRLAHQDQALEELGNEVYRQQEQITKLETAVRQLATRLAESEASQPSGNASEEIPPHY